jgi:RNA polymerase sigma-70 factor (ECF subfamily)
LLFQPEDYPLPRDDQSVYVEQTQALYAGIRRLKKVERAIILLYLEEQTYEEIAEITGLTKTNVSVKLVRIKAKLEKTVKSLMKSNQL